MQYWRSLWYFVVQRGEYSKLPFFAESPAIRAHVFSLALILDLWSKPHYRAPTLQQDLLNNLKNVALPGTGIPLSYFCVHKWIALVFIAFVNPLICLFAAVRDGKASTPASKLFAQYLLSPRDWFSLWQLNCRLASVHSLTTAAPGFAMENKWDFLVKGEAEGVAVSPYMKLPKITLKNKNIEGGMGIHFFENASAGGDWIIQPVFDNAAPLAKVLPTHSPLSTFRVITISRGALNPENPYVDARTKATIAPEDLITPLCCVFRAGREGAATDHKSILYDVDFGSGRIKSGAVNEHWYRLGVQHVNLWKTAFPENDHKQGRFDSHPDTGVFMVGAEIVKPSQLFALCVDAHYKLLADVPVAGWDIAVTTAGTFLLEANLSCNFFMGSFDQAAYFSFVDECFAEVDRRRHAEA